MTAVSTLRRGDRVTHPRRPEWGVGEVVQAQSISHEGRPAQRVTVDFKHHRRVTLNTAVAPLHAADATPGSAARGPRPQEDKTPMPRSRNTPSPSGGGWLDQLEKEAGGAKHELHELPHAMSDPFLSDRDRLAATLDTFYYSTDPLRLLEWARMQTGLDDPLTRYTRQELEQAFPRFARDRDQHLLAMVRQFKRNNDTQGLRSIADKSRAPRAARSALDRAFNA